MDLEVLVRRTEGSDSSHGFGLPGLRVIATVPSGAAVGGLTCPPDGHALAFHVLQFPGTVYAVGTHDVASGAFGPGIAPGHQPTWSPDGTHIAATWNLRISSTNGISLPVTVSDVPGPRTGPGSPTSTSAALRCESSASTGAPTRSWPR